MKNEELKQIVMEEIERNPEAYWKAIVPALAESRLNSTDVICGYAEYIGLTISKTQRRWMTQHHEELNRVKREKEGMNAQAERKIAEWKNSGIKVYSVEDFPDWVVDKLIAIGGDKHSVLRKTAAELMDKEPSAFLENWKDVPEQFCILDDKAYFTSLGYKYLIASSQSRGWMWSYEWERWKKECGLFAQE